MFPDLAARFFGVAPGIANRLECLARRIDDDGIGFRRPVAKRPASAALHAI